MKKADIEKLVGTDHEVRIQAPNSTWHNNAKFGQVIAVHKYQPRSLSYHRTLPIRDVVGNQRGGAHVRVERERWGGETETVDEVVPYSHIHAETRAEHEARVAKEQEARDAHRREEERVKQERRGRAKNVEAAFRTLGVTVRDNHNGTVLISLDEAERILQRIGEIDS